MLCPSGQEFVSKCRSDIHPGKACEVAARDKVVKYTGAMPEGCTDSDFVPLVYETYGAVNKAGTSWLKSVCNELSDEPAIVLEHMLNVMSATLQMGNGQIDVSGMTLHRSSNCAVEQSRTALYHNQTMALLQQYVWGE